MILDSGAGFCNNGVSVVRAADDVGAGGLVLAYSGELLGGNAGPPPPVRHRFQQGSAPGLQGSSGTISSIFSESWYPFFVPAQFKNGFSFLFQFYFLHDIS